MEIDRWVGAYRVRSTPWIDGKRIYFNVRYYAPGQAVSKPPVWDKTIYITDNDEGRNILNNFLHSIVEYVAGLEIGNREITLTFTVKEDKL